METVYRIEHKTRRSDENDKVNLGPYNTRGYEYEGHSEMTNTHSKDEVWPGLRGDFPNWSKTDNTESYFCAFNTIEQLKNWFNGFEQTLNDAGFVIVEYSVNFSVIGISNKQCFFHEEAIIEKKLYANLVD
jgi:hypothetical protein